MDWQDRRDIAQAKRDAKRETRTEWDEFNFGELRRLAMASGEWESDVDDLDADRYTDDDRETLYDARYHAHKLYTSLMRLWRNAEHAEKASGGDGA